MGFPEAAGRESLLDAQTREIIALAVSATNGCSYCVNSHSAAIKKQGASDELLGEVLAIAGIFNMTNAIAEGFDGAGTTIVVHPGNDVEIDGYGNVHIRLGN